MEIWQRPTSSLQTWIVSLVHCKAWMMQPEMLPFRPAFRLLRSGLEVLCKNNSYLLYSAWLWEEIMSVVWRISWPIPLSFRFLAMFPMGLTITRKGSRNSISQLSGVGKVHKLQLPRHPSRALEVKVRGHSVCLTKGFIEWLHSGKARLFRVQDCTRNGEKGLLSILSTVYWAQLGIGRTACKRKVVSKQ